MNFNFRAIQEELVKNAPLIFTSLGVAGVGITIGVTAKQAVKLDGDLKRIDEEGKSAKETVAVVAKDILPIVISGGCTALLIIAAHKSSATQIAALTSSLAAASQKDILDKGVGEVFASKDDKDHGKFVPMDVNVSNNEPMMIKDLVTGQVFTSTINGVMNACTSLNEAMFYDGTNKTLSWFYEELGLDVPSICEEVEFSPDHAMKIEWGAYLMDNFKAIPCIDYEIK